MFPSRYRSYGADSLFFCVGIYKDLAPPEPFFQRPARPCRTSLGWPSRSSNYTAEVATAKGVILVGQHICLNVAKGRFRFVFDTVVEGLDDVFLKMGGTRVGLNNRFSFGLAVFVISETEHIHFHAGGDPRDHWMHMLRNTRSCTQTHGGPDR